MAETKPAVDAQPWIDMIVNEEHVLDSLVGICTRNGWKKVAELTRVIYSSELTRPEVKRFYLPLSSGNSITLPKMLYPDFHIYVDGEKIPSSYYSVKQFVDGSCELTFEPEVMGKAEVYFSRIDGRKEVEFAVAKHYILSNLTGNLFGMAVTSKFTSTVAGTGHHVPFAIPSKNSTWGTKMEPQDLGMFYWAKQRGEKLFLNNVLYFYQLESFSSLESGEYILGWEDSSEFVRASLDVEVEATMWDLEDATNALEFKVSKQHPDYMQSPIAKARTRVPALESIEQKYGLDIPYTNWWDDSKVHIKGFIDSKSLMFIILADTAPVWHDNAVPAIPLYMGDFDVNGEKEEIVRRSLTFDLYKNMTKKSTVISHKPMTNTGAKIKVWLSGDVDDGANDGGEYVEVKVAGKVIKKFTTKEAKEPATDKGEAEYLGEFPIDNVEGKNSIEVEVSSPEGVSGYYPVAARVWVEITIPTQMGGKGAAALFTGTAYPQDKDTNNPLGASGSFDYDDPDKKRFQQTILPLLKKYPHYPSNGIDNIMVKRTKNGAYYQSYYFSWNTPSNLIPPLRKGIDDHKHPRAWQNAEHLTYKFAFTPSRYSGKAHASKALIVHPEDGTHGTLRNVILVSPLTIMNGDELTTIDEYCTDSGEHKYKIYSYYLVEGISPLTKRPGTPFRPAGLGILKDGNIELPPLPKDDLPSPPPFIVSISPASSRIEEGESIDFTSHYTTLAPIANFKWSASNNVNSGAFTVDNAKFTFNSPGKYTIKFTITNSFGQTGEATAEVEVDAAAPPPTPPTIPPGTISCGKTNDSGGGRYTEKMHEMGANPGSVTITYDMYSAPDRMDVYYQNQLLGSTGGLVSGKGSLSFKYNPIGGVTQIKVVMTSDSDGTAWEYTVNCPVS